MLWDIKHSENITDARQQNCKHSVTAHRAKQRSFHDTHDQKSPITASPLTLRKPPLAHTCPNPSLWPKQLQDVAVEMKSCILIPYPYSSAQRPQILCCSISNIKAASRGLSVLILCKSHSPLPACKKPMTEHFLPSSLSVLVQIAAIFSWLLF